MSCHRCTDTVCSQMPHKVLFFFTPFYTTVHVCVYILFLVLFRIFSINLPTLLVQSSRFEDQSSVINCGISYMDWELGLGSGLGCTWKWEQHWNKSRNTNLWEGLFHRLYFWVVIECLVFIVNDCSSTTVQVSLMVLRIPLVVDWDQVFLS